MSISNIIPPEIINDTLSELITDTIRMNGLRTILEIGASSGLGSTASIIRGIELAGLRDKAQVYCLEVSKERCAEFRKNVMGYPYVHLYNYCSVGIKDYLSPYDIEMFYHIQNTNLNKYPLEEVLRWREEEIDYIRENRIPLMGLHSIIEHSGIDDWDFVLIDGSAFTGFAELDFLQFSINDSMIGKWICLDDTNDIKNYRNYQMLLASHSYDLVEENQQLRNGYALFRRLW